jgi:hypothetical protein
MAQLPRIWTDPDLVAWLERSRLNIVRGMRDHLDDPRITQSAERNKRNYGAAAENLEAFLREPVAAG